MKLIHTADLHIGKIVNEFSMLEEQKHILKQILSIVEDEKADGIIIAGDVYDRSIAPAEAVTVLDEFLSTLVERKVKVFMISGNHDSAERVGFASRILDAKGLYIGGAFDGTVKMTEFNKDGVKADIYLLPFMKPQTMDYFVRKERNDEESEHDGPIVRTFEEGVQAAISKITLNPEAVNIMVTHHFVTSGGTMPEESDSETALSLGGIEKVDTSVFDGFDYVALGHIHRPQKIGRDTIRYAGSPLKYSFSEVNHKKSVTVIEINEAKEIKLSTRDLIPLHDMRKIKGSLKDLMDPQIYQLADTNDYIHATLTDQEELIDPIGTLRSVYPNIMQLELEKNQLQAEEKNQNYFERKNKSALELFDDFFTTVTGREFDEKRQEIMKDIIEGVIGGDR